MSFLRSNPHVACLLLMLIMAAGCRSKPASARRMSTLSAVAQDIERRGYSAKESSIVVPTTWEVSTFRMRRKKVSSFRANKPQAGSSDYFCRFKFFEETYDSVEDARHRLANLHLPSPDAAEENEYERVMRSGFRVGSTTYVFQTDAIVFWDEVRRFAKEIAGATQGVELTN